MPSRRLRRLLLGAPFVLCTIAAPVAAQALASQAPQELLQGLPRTVARVKPSVVGVGTLLKTRQPAIVFTGTGFIVGDGLSVITNAHVIPNTLDVARMEEIGIVIGNGGEAVSFRGARVAGLDREHDLAHLRLSGTPLAPLVLAGEGAVAEGQALAFTGYPLGMRLGLHAATHRALLAAIAPVVRPSLTSRQLDPRAITQLQRRPFDIYHLDGTAYPGNSGSPLYDPASGAVVGVINMVFLKGLKESAVSDPSGITYAIPVRHVHELLQRSQ
ncbi:S1 family peptidase [Telluria aromaticivorans]|uniref:Trypsin-like peptidase domain-containing protein n=1 Tax=Telluria aromaticivorans TaxID=2725995 RepID=A0A7Y2K028_9BURK|nr:serine protease [Telluria aromaticivorans]NNG24197.1 trypsin-like peptidase domain-containing protein [Telluria aromaticivorans]